MVIDAIEYINHIFLLVICFDLWFYLSHRILHSHLYFIHKIHHEANHELLNWKDTFKAHVLETPFQSLGLFTPYLYLEFNKNLFIITMFLLTVRGSLRHDVRFIWLVGNHHILHHKYPKYNYGDYWLDSLLSTDYPFRNECEVGLIYY